MVLIEPFAVERWMETHETTAKHNLAETCCASVSIDDLKGFSDNVDNSATSASFPFPSSTKLTYGPIRGSLKLRTSLANLYPDPEAGGCSSCISPESVLVAPGGINANFLLLYTLVSAGDHVVCQYPTYQQLYSVPESLGAEVSLWKSRHEDGTWRLRTDELGSLVKPNTKLIILKNLSSANPGNPVNPTGAILPRNTLNKVVRIARERSIYVLCDEVYRPLFHSLEEGEEKPPSLLSLGYERTVVTGSMSKAYALAGIRVGWIASRGRDLIEQCALSRDYTTISVSQVDDQIASYALEGKRMNNLLDRNTRLARRNVLILEKFVNKHQESCAWIRSLAGTTAFIRFSRDGKALDDVALCEVLMEKLGLLLVPGSKCFGDKFSGFVRMGYACETEELEAGLAELSTFIRKELASVPLA